METHLLKAALSSRESLYLILDYIAAKAYTREFQILIEKIKEYYDKDETADHVVREVFLAGLEAAIQNKKHIETFTNIINEAEAVDTSTANLQEIILQAKLQEVGNKLSVALINNDKNVPELLDQYRELSHYTSLEELSHVGVEVLTSDDIDRVLESAASREHEMIVYPMAFNERLEGRAAGGHHIIIFARPEMGKCLAVGTEVLMHDGTVKKVEDVVEGDTVAGPSGARKVLGTTKGTSDMYRVTYPWGESYVVNDEHVLSLKRSKAEGRHKHGDILNVPVREYMAWPESKKQRYKGWKCGVDYPEAELPIKPYLLGLWLGDGTSTKPSITTKDAEVLAAFVDEYGEPSYVEKEITYSFWKTPLFNQLKSMELIGNKHIPQHYLCSSRQQRLALLAGLIDADGHLVAHAVGYQLVTSSDVLKDGYVKLARSLGFHATAKQVWKRATNANHEGDWYWSVYIGAEAFAEVPVRLARKRGQQAATPKRKGLQFGITVECIGKGEYAGFALDGDHLFLLGDYTVTHNSAFNITIACGFARQKKEGIYIINEDRVEDIYTRIISNLTGLTRDEIMRDRATAKQMALERGLEYIRLVSLAPGTLKQVEAFADKYRPKWMIVDQLRNLDVKEANKVLQLEYAATGLRNIAKKYNLLMISSTQAGDSGEGKKLLTMGDVDFSNTGVAAQADVLVGIGGDPVDVMEGRRIINISKNKLSGLHQNFPVKLIPQVSRYMSFRQAGVDE